MQRRCHSLITLIERENTEIEEKERAEKRKSKSNSNLNRNPNSGSNANIAKENKGNFNTSNGAQKRKADNVLENVSKIPKKS